MAHGVSLKELEIKARRATDSSSYGDRVPAVSNGEKRVHIPKDVVPNFFVGDVVDN